MNLKKIKPTNHDRYGNYLFTGMDPYPFHLAIDDSGCVMARREREFCCDQRAVEAGCSPGDLARALSLVGELQRPHELSISFGGHTNDLLNRVKYLLGFQTTLHYVPTHSILYYGSLLGVFILFSIGKNQFLPLVDENNRSTSNMATVDTLPKDPYTKVVRNKWIQIAEEISTDTIPEYRLDKNLIDQTETFEIQYDLDTMIQLNGTDTLPGKKKMVMIQADGKVTVIVNGDTVSVYQNPMDLSQLDMRKWQDSMRILQRQIIAEYKNQKLDSLMAQQRKNMEAQRRYMKTQKAYLDSLNRKLPEMRSQIQSFGFAMPDSVRKFSFTIPPMPEMNIDSLIIRQDFLKKLTGTISLDSILRSNRNIGLQEPDNLLNVLGEGIINLFPDSLFSSFHPPYAGLYGYPSDPLKSKEMKELDKKIRAKERELIELRREQQKKYREELQKMQNQ